MNSAPTGPDCSAPALSLGYNLVGSTAGCTLTSTVGDLINIDARLAPLTGTLAYHPLLDASPAINAGNPAGCQNSEGSLLQADERGLSRFGRCDIGAYEEQFIKSVSTPRGHSCHLWYDDLYEPPAG